MRPRRAAIIFIFVAFLLDILAIGLVIPVLPGLIEKFVGGDTSRAAKWFGAFSTMFALMQFVCAPILGVLSDRFGRRPVLLLSCLGLGLDYIVMAVAPTLGWLFAGRIVSGITAASFTTANAYIADVTPPARRAGSFGLLGAAWGIGFVVGPALGGLLGGVDPRLPFWAAAALALANFLYGFFVLPESLPPRRRRAFTWSRANPVGALRLLRSHPELFGLALVSLLFSTAHQALPSVFVLYTGFRFHWGPRTVGFMLALVGMAGVVVQGFLVKRAVGALGERRALLVGLAAGAVMFAIYGLAPTPALFCLGIPFGAVSGFYGPALTSLMTRRVGRSEQGALQGASGSIMALTGLYSPAMFSLVLSAAIGPYAGWGVPGAAFVLASLLVVVAFGQAWAVTRPAEVRG